MREWGETPDVVKARDVEDVGDNKRGKSPCITSLITIGTEEH